MFISLLVSCAGPGEQASADAEEVNPPAEGFNMQQSDSEAIEIADNVMKAMGGRAAWNDLHYVSWNFFGARDLVWDKETGRVRIDFPSRNTCYLINVEDMTGEVYVGGQAIEEPDSLQKMITEGKNIWINDSYWLFMPFKLKDSGVTLTYLREDTLPGGMAADVLGLRFSNVGVTPDNKYEVYVDRSDTLVKQWAYFQNYTQDSASAIWPWDNYTRQGALLISADRSDGRGPKNVHVYDSLPDIIFDDPSARIGQL